jgi:hypothetical protein
MKNSLYICGEIVGIDPLMTKRYQASFSLLFSLVLLDSLVMKEEDEVFKPIPDYEGLYSISNKGRVRSDARFKWTGKGFAYFKDRILIPQIDQRGYHRVGLHKDKKHKSHQVHRLVAITFLKGIHGETVNHKDGIKAHNWLLNLEWASYSENQKHAFRTGLRKSHMGINNPSAKLNDSKVIQIREMLKNGISQVKIAKHFHIAPYAIQRIASNKGWNHIK